ncbi:site-specific integrase [Vibrio sp. SS-MA-C1-2]|uniref:site-specific integrase n=1 Tax=Vibrio sp. SS-MA-C1-2 TaxID=2908646 RepID=UPI001F1DE3F6|nr:site-specific integrase [Vibrio sp. SS-MA-C1-2]UJF18540.1 site-specific integrase [Vibrio sp. SS-MA-C1-2]
MAHIRTRPNGRIQFDMHIYGQRFREGTKMMATPKNLAIAKAQLKQMNAEIDLGTFQYRDYFPTSKKIALFEQLQREKHPDRLFPFFDTYANDWFERQSPKWKPSYCEFVRINLDRYLIPELKNLLVSEVTLYHIEQFRYQLMDSNKDRARPLSNNRINSIFWTLIAIMHEASDVFKFDYPFKRYKPLRHQKSDVNPLSVSEVECFLSTVDETWRDYFIVRFWTGIRSCEAHGLMWKHIDLTHRLIKIRQNWVNGELGALKTESSRRDLIMSETLLAAFEQIKAKADDASADAFVFMDKNGRPLDTHYVSNKIWHPTLKKAGLKKRRAYETRHTAAVLHISALENPLYISHMLGHSDTSLLFDVYAPYVANAAREDGKKFNQLMADVGGKRYV